MKEFILSKRYARGLLKVARDARNITAVNDGLQRFALRCAEKRVFFRWLTCEEVSQKKRKAALGDMAKAMGLPDVLRDFLSVLISAERIRYLPQIAKIFLDMTDEEMNIVRGTLYAADKAGLDGAAKGISKFLHNKTKKDVRITASERPQLIGGAMLQIKNDLWDASVKKRLQEMKENLCQ